jgi:transposase
MDVNLAHTIGVVHSGQRRQKRNKSKAPLGTSHVALQTPLLRDQGYIEKCLSNPLIEPASSRARPAYLRKDPMDQPRYLLGIDISAKTFTSTLFDRENYGKAFNLSNDQDGFAALHRRLADQQISPADVAIVLEATGTYAEQLCYALAALGYRIAVEAPHKTKRAFHPLGAKSDPLDSRQLAEYAFRFYDQLQWWSPAPALVEQIRVLQTTREQLTEQLVASQNTLHAISLKVVRTALAEDILVKTIAHLKEQIKKIDDDIRQRLGHDSTFGPMMTLLTSIPGVGMLLAAQFFVLSRGFTIPLDARKLAAHLGICPLENQSGSSRRDLHRRSRGSGPRYFRKLLYLAAMSVRTHTPDFRTYFLRLVQAGKPKRLVLNNIENRLLRIICAVIRDRKPYIPNYRSIHPRYA